MQRSTTQSGAASLSLAEFTSILECGASEFCDSTFGFELAKVFPHEGLGPVAQLLMATLTIGDGVSCFARNLPALQTSTKLSLSVHGDLARIDYKIDDGAGLKMRTFHWEYCIRSWLDFLDNDFGLFPSS